MTIHSVIARCWLLVVFSGALLSGESKLTNPFQDAVDKERSLQRLDHCFCELRGQVDDCCCDVESVDTLNKDKVYPVVSSVIRKTFFKFFKVNLQRGCPFWPDDGRCVLKDCHVEKCSEEDIPSFLKGASPEKGGVPSLVDSCDTVSEEEKQLSSIDSTISLEQLEEFKIWQEYDMTEDNFCELDDENSVDLSWVDLTLNPERYTGYSGHSTERIWKAIYHENCFRPEEENGGQSSVPLFHSSLLQGMCLEKRAFYRVISGLHASINIHLSAEHVTTNPSESNQKFGPNLNEFVRRFDAATTNGQGPSWLKNLYFAYLLVLRAVSKAEPFWRDFTFYTGDPIEEREIKENIMEIVQAAKGCSNLFDETLMFTGNTSSQLKKDFKSHFKNISRIMDCVGCDKCKLWGKLQVQGVGTALKVLFSPRKNGMPFYLSRMEIISLFNVLGRFSSSINFLQKFREMELVNVGDVRKPDIDEHFRPPTKEL